MSTELDHRKALIHVLRMAYSGEKAAAYAYNAQGKSLRDSYQREQIRTIEEEEIEHREIVGRMLSSLSAKPQLWRECMMATIGRTVGFACYLIGWFLPMYFAGRLEHDNVNEYGVAAQHAKALGMNEEAIELERLGVVELRHETFFHDAVQGHYLLPIVSRFFIWGNATPALAAHPSLSLDETNGSIV